MSKDIFSSRFWLERLRYAQERNQEYQALYRCDPVTWLAIERTHRILLASLIEPGERILDAGCAWGRLLTLLPTNWLAQHQLTDYLGIDLSPDFIAKAKEMYPKHYFMCADMRHLDMPDQGRRFNWCICIAVKDMVIGNAGLHTWQTIEHNLLRMSKRLLLLTYDVNDQPEIILSR